MKKSSLREQRIALALAATAAFASTGGAESSRVSDAVPPDAQSVIGDVQVAAQRRDLQALRELMAPSFRWNFGPDGESHEAAIQAWQADPDYLRQMTHVLRKGCFPDGPQRITCPGRGGTHFRAGFQSTREGWKMSYFLAGD